MQQMSGTLLDLILYLALVALGAFLGSRPQIQSLPMPWLGRFQTAALLLIVTLGAELGSNEEIISSWAPLGSTPWRSPSPPWWAACWLSTP